jgi:hypothetical protein
LRQHVQLGRRACLGRGTVAVGHESSPDAKKAFVGRVANIALARSTRTTATSGRWMTASGIFAGKPAKRAVKDLLNN